MKKLLTLLLALMLLLTSLPAMAGMEVLPDEIADLFDVPAWEGYEVPYTAARPDKLSYIWLEYFDCGMVYLTNGRQDVLCLIERNSKGEMRIKARNFEAVWGNDVPIFDSTPYEPTDSVSIQLYGDNYMLSFRKYDGEWRIGEIQDQARAFMAYIRPDRIGITKGETADWYEGYVFDTSKMEYAYGVYDNRFAAFNYHDFPITIKEARAKLTNPPVTPTDFFTPVSVKLRAGEKYDVFAAPGRSSYRAAKGKAFMSTNDWVQIFGEEDGWLLVQYDISRDQMRFGYIDASALPKGTVVQPLCWYNELPLQTIKYAVNVTDDPLVSGSIIHSLSAGEQVTLLSSFGNWYYIETKNNSGKTLRGFVPMSCIDIITDAELLG